MKFITKNLVRIHDIDMAGILYFPRQYRFAHDAMEDFFEFNGIHFEEVIKNSDYMFVIRHSEADYLNSLRVGNKIEVQLFIESIGTTSFVIFYEIYKEDKTLAGTVKTVHVCIDPKTRLKKPIPAPLKALLQKYLIDS